MQSAFFCAVMALMPATSFRNDGLHLPSVSWLGVSSSDFVTGRSGWNVWDHPMVGTSYARALGYQLWWETGAAAGLSTTVLNERPEPLVSLRASTGLRYNFLEEELRPFAGVFVETLLLTALDGASIPNNGFLGFPLFIGLRPVVGVEWIFGNEMSLQIDAGAAGFIVPDDRAIAGLFLPATVTRVAWNIYF